jgi:galactokinase
MEEIVVREFERKFCEAPAFVVRAPGRINLIGEHTDYNDGFVLPMAIDRSILIALRPRADKRILLHSTDYPLPADFSLDELPHLKSWSDYVSGMAWALQDVGCMLKGWEGVLVSDIPIASGLSSSAALELAVARAFWVLSRWHWDGSQMAKVAKKMENEWLNLKSGIMDQMISACGKQGHALLIDCRDLSTDLVHFPKDVSIVVMDTGVRRGLVTSAYNERVAQCQAASSHFGVSSLREVSQDIFNRKSSGLDELLLKRARHVVSENERTLLAADAMRTGDAACLGGLMNESHTSLRDDYEVSCAELNLMVEAAQSQVGCLGARMTGGGFGGCAIALVQSDHVDDFSEAVYNAYTRGSDYPPRIFECFAADGADVFK